MIQQISRSWCNELHIRTAMSSKAQPVGTAASLCASTDVATKRKLRDPDLNSARILDATRDLFAEFGYSVSMEQIAARAEVGVGTIYRRFQSKTVLLEAVADESSACCIQLAKVVLADVNAEDAVFEFLRRCLEVPSCWQSAISLAPGSRRSARKTLAELTVLLEQILDMSRHVGTIRDDIDVDDLVVTLVAVGGVAAQSGDLTSHGSLRFLELALDGLRPPSGVRS
jgi:AcrR family transcriptional regulator